MGENKLEELIHELQRLQRIACDNVINEFIDYYELDKTPTKPVLVGTIYKLYTDYCTKNNKHLRYTHKTSFGRQMSLIGFKKSRNMYERFIHVNTDKIIRGL